MQVIPSYPHTHAKQVEWFRLFERTILYHMECIRVDYDAYVKNPIPLQVTRSYSSMMDSICTANDYIREATRIVRVEEELHPEIRHRDTLELMARCVMTLKINKASIDEMYYKMQELYLQVTAFPPVEEPLNPEEVHKWFCIH